MCQIASFSKTSGFCDYQCNFRFLSQFLFVWFIYYTFSCVVSLIYWFLNRFFYETLVDQSFGKPKFCQNFVVWTYIQASDFCCFKVSYCKPMFIINCKFLLASGDCIIHHNYVILMLINVILIKRYITYIYSEITFYWLSYRFYKTQKSVFVFDKQTF